MRQGGDCASRVATRQRGMSCRLGAIASDPHNAHKREPVGDETVKDQEITSNHMWCPDDEVVAQRSHGNGLNGLPLARRRPTGSQWRQPNVYLGDGKRCPTSGDDPASRLVFGPFGRGARVERITTTVPSKIKFKLNCQFICTEL